MMTSDFFENLIKSDAFKYSRPWLFKVRFMVECALEYKAINKDEYINLMNMIHTEVAKTFDKGIFG